MNELRVTVGDRDVLFSCCSDASFATDTAISRYNGDAPYKELERWEADDADHTMTLDDGANGWDPDEMFKKNAREFNVQSTYDEELSGYTVALNRDDSEEYRKKEQFAARIAAEIEKNSTSKVSRVCLCRNQTTRREF